MIVRTPDDGSLILINQTDHAKLSGHFAAHWGNELFCLPKDREASIRAAAHHDHGWLRYEAQPEYDPLTKSTPAFFQTKSSPQTYEAYGWAIDWLTEIDAYSGLLINRHRTGLYRSRYGAVQQPVSVSRLRNDPMLDEFVARYEAKQQVALARFSPQQFAVDYQMLQFWDLMSLALCLRDPREETFALVPNSYDGDGTQGVEIKMVPLPGDRIALDPYPFDVKELQLGYVYRQFPTRDFPDEETFRRAYFGAAPQLRQFTFV